MTAVVFVGPTIRAESARDILDATYLPPVKQGDVRRIVSEGVKAIGIIDGQFHSVRSVWHKEILWAISEGIKVFGSASIGALRASELHAFGMIGVGRVFEMYRSGLLEDDDEVAVIHAPAEQNYAAMSVAMVNIRATLAVAVEHGVLTEETAEALRVTAKEMYYPQRNYRRLLEATQLPVSELERLREWLPRGQVDQKRADAIEMLEVMKQQVKMGPTKVTYWFEHRSTFSKTIAKSQIHHSH